MLTYDQVVLKLRQIKAMNFVKTHRIGNTGIGKTLEDLLGIDENNIAGPDAEMMELKSARKNASSMLTLFTKAPLPPKANSVLLRKFGYPSKKGNKKKELHTTVNAISYRNLKGKKGFKIKVKKNRVELVSAKSEILGYWDKETLKNSFEKKLPRLMYVKAEARGRGLQEEFWFNEAWILKEFNFENFLKLLKNGIILVDIRIGQYPNGKPHDHGTGFRVLPDKLELCFSHRKQII